MKYVLLKRISTPGYAHPYSIIKVDEDFSVIEKEMKSRIYDGAPVRDFRIMTEIDFDFKYSIELKEEK